MLLPLDTVIAADELAGIVPVQVYVWGDTGIAAYALHVHVPVKAFASRYPGSAPVDDTVMSTETAAGVAASLYTVVSIRIGAPFLVAMNACATRMVASGFIVVGGTTFVVGTGVVVATGVVVGRGLVVSTGFVVATGFVVGTGVVVGNGFVVAPGLVVGATVGATVGGTVRGSVESCSSSFSGSDSCVSGFSVVTGREVAGFVVAGLVAGGFESGLSGFSVPSACSGFVDAGTLPRPCASAAPANGAVPKKARAVAEAAIAAWR